MSLTTQSVCCLNREYYRDSIPINYIDTDTLSSDTENQKESTGNLSKKEKHITDLNFFVYLVTKGGFKIENNEFYFGNINDNACTLYCNIVNNSNTKLIKVLISIYQSGYYFRYQFLEDSSVFDIDNIKKAETEFYVNKNHSYNGFKYNNSERDATNVFENCINGKHIGKPIYQQFKNVYRKLNAEDVYKDIVKQNKQNSKNPVYTNEEMLKYMEGGNGRSAITLLFISESSFKPMFANESERKYIMSKPHEPRLILRTKSNQLLQFTATNVQGGFSNLKLIFTIQ